jgi:SAM-dependent methyltransferase
MVEDYQKILKYYGKHLVLSNPSDSEFVGWSSKKSQETRWGRLILNYPIDNCSVLDVGCGIGDFFQYLLLQGKYLDIDYVGIDINTIMIKEAVRKHPSATFLNGPLSRLIEYGASDMPNKWDYVFASGVFTVKVEDNYSHIQQNIEHLCGLANKHVAFNFLDTFTDDAIRDPDLYYYDRIKLLDYVKDKWDGYIITGHENGESDSTIHVRV